MQWSWCGRAFRGRRPLSGALAAPCALLLAACNPQPIASANFPRGATVSFESIDGAPPVQFHQLVEHLNDEAESRRLAVASRESPSVYRVRGYLAAKVVRRQTTIAWVWDVFDRDDHRALRISGQETARSLHRDAWSAADDAMMQRIARDSMAQLAAFLTSPEVAPGTPESEPRMVVAGAAAAPDALPGGDTRPPPGANCRSVRARSAGPRPVGLVRIHPRAKLRVGELDSYCEPPPALL